jgi:hypothetical protein
MDVFKFPDSIGAIFALDSRLGSTGLRSVASASDRFYAYGEKGPVKIGYDPIPEVVVKKKD